jgi:hypothetical protein
MFLLKGQFRGLTYLKEVSLCGRFSQYDKPPKGTPIYASTLSHKIASTSLPSAYYTPIALRHLKLIPSIISSVKQVILSKFAVTSSTINDFFIIQMYAYTIGTI